MQMDVSMDEITQRKKQGELRLRLADCRKKSAAENIPRLRAVWFAVSALLLTAVCLFVFLQGSAKLWGAAPVFCAAALIVGTAVRFGRAARELRETEQALAALEKRLAALQPDEPARAPDPSRPPQPSARIGQNGRIRHRIV